jgi:chromosome partitioning protein
MGKVIAVINEKGGTGKTSTVINTGVALARAGKKVLLVDLDLQASLTFAFACDTSKGTICNVLDAKDAIQAMDVIRAIRVQREGLEIIPANNDLSGIEVELAQEKVGRENWIKGRLSGLTGYDFIFLDCSPSFSYLNVSALTYATDVIIPLPLEPLAVNGLKNVLTNIDLVKKAYNPGLNILGLLPVLVNSRRSLSGEIMAEIRAGVKERIFKSFIRTNVSLAEAPSFSKSVLLHRPRSNGATDYKAFADELLKVIRG